MLEEDNCKMTSKGSRYIESFQGDIGICRKFKTRTTHKETTSLSSHSCG